MSLLKADYDSSIDHYERLAFDDETQSGHTHDEIWYEGGEEQQKKKDCLKYFCLCPQFLKSQDENLYDNLTEDPFEDIKKEDSWNEQNSLPKNILNWVDFYDRFYSRTFSLRDNTICNFFFCFWAWAFSREKCVLQFIIVFFLVRANPE